MHNATLKAALATLIGATGLAEAPEPAAAGATSPDELFSGRAFRVSNRAQAQNNIERAIEKSVSEMNFIKRPFARSRLKGSTYLCGQLKFSFPDSDIAVNCDQRKADRAPASGKGVPWYNAKKKKHILKNGFSGGRLVQWFDSGDGKRKNVYTMSAGGKRMIMTATLYSSQLPAPMTYSIAYAR